MKLLLFFRKEILDQKLGPEAVKFIWQNAPSQNQSESKKQKETEGLSGEARGEFIKNFQTELTTLERETILKKPGTEITETDKQKFTDQAEKAKKEKLAKLNYLKPEEREKIKTFMEKMIREVIQEAEGIGYQASKLGSIRTFLEARLEDIQKPKSWGNWVENKWTGVKNFFGASEDQKEQDTEKQAIESFLKDIDDTAEKVMSGTSLETILAQKTGIKSILDKNNISFKTPANRAELLQDKTVLITHLRDNSRYEEAQAEMENILEKQFAQARANYAKENPGEVKKIEKKAQERVDQMMEQKASKTTWVNPEKRLQEKGAKKMTPEEMKKAREDLIEGEKRKMLNKEAGRLIKENEKDYKFTTEEKKIWEIYDDMVDPGNEFWNVSDATQDMILEELVINAPLIIVSGGVASLARAGITAGARAMAGRMAVEWAGETMLKRGAFWAAGTVVEGAAFEGANITLGKITGLNQEDLSALSGTDWAERILWSSATLGAFHGTGKLTQSFFQKEVKVSGESVIAKTNFTKLFDFITDPVVKKVSLNLIQTGTAVNMEAATMLLVGAVQHGAYAGNLDEFWDNFGEQVGHAYMVVGALKTSGKLIHPLMKPMQEWGQKLGNTSPALEKEKPDQPLSDNYNSKEEFKKLLLLIDKQKTSPYPRIQKAIEEAKVTILKCCKRGTNANDVLNSFVEDFDNLFDKTKLLAQEDKIQEKLLNFTDNNKERATELRESLKNFYTKSLEILAVYRKQERLKTVSHRGFGFGEQLSFDAISNALQQGVKMIELDIVTTKDGTLVVSHDGKTKINGKSKRISELEWDEIESGKGTIDKTPSPMYKLDTLLKFLEQFHDSGSKLNIEIKEKGTTNALVKYLKEHPEVQKHIVISAFDPIALLEVHKEFPNIPIGYNTFVTNSNIKSILKKDFEEHDPIFQKAAIVGGNTLPKIEVGSIKVTHHTNLPKEIREMLKESKGYMTVFSLRFLVNNVATTHKINLTVPTLFSTKKLETLKKEAEELGIQLVATDPQKQEIKKYSQYLDAFLVSDNNQVTYPRLEKFNKKNDKTAENFNQKYGTAIRVPTEISNSTQKVNNFTDLIIKKDVETWMDPEYLKMYEVSGQDRISEHSLNRYKKDKEQDEAIKQEIENPHFVEDNKKIKSPSNTKSPTTNIQEKIKYASGEEIASLIKLGLEDSDIEVQRASAKMIWRAPEEEKTSLRNIVSKKVKLGLENPDTKVQKVAVDMIRYSSEKERASLIKLCLEAQNVEVQKIAAEIISYTPFEERASLIKLCLETQNIEVQKVVASEILDLPEKESIPLQNIFSEKIKIGLENPNIEAQKVAVDMIRYVSKKEESFFRNIVLTKVKLGLENPNIEVQKVAVEMIPYVPEKEIAPLVEFSLEIANIEVQKRVTKMIRIAPKEEKTRLIKISLENPNVEVQKVAIEIIPYMPENEIADLIELGLKNPNIEIQKVAAKMIKYAQKSEVSKLLELVMEKRLGEDLIEPPLYKNKDISQDRFSRTKFEKTGSGITLLGGKLKAKTIVRHIKPEAFLTWQKLYENPKIWEEAGFDYVPIEPIQSYRLNKNGLVDVMSGVLDLSLGSWEINKFKDELREQSNKIKKVLDVLKIKHGHTHEGNFCLRFFRDENGGIDFRRVPRLYLIDFDMAKSPAPTNKI